jgi:RNA polymerase sigma-70 factor (ECF subfamily)
VAESIPGEAELVRRSRQGDVAAFRQLVATHAEPLWRCARALCRDDHEAEDLTQETLVEAWRSLTRFDESRQFSTWLYGILRHRFLTARRKPRPVASGEGQAADRPGRETSPPVAAERAEEARLVQAAVAALPAEHRVVVELRFFAGASLDEIATLVGCPLGTVKSRLHRALEKLRLGRGGVNLFATAGESTVSTPRARP